MKKLASTATLILILSLTSISEINAQTIADWQPTTNLDPTELDLLYETLSSGNPRVLEFEFTPYWSGDRLEGCGYTFKVLMKDRANQSHQPLVAHGSISYFSSEDSVPHLSFQIGLKDIKELNNRVWERTAAVHYAYLRFGDKSLAGKEYATASGKNEAVTFKYHDPEKDKLMTWLSIPETLSIRFNRKQNDTELHFDLSVLNHKEAWSDQSSCYRELTFGQ